MAGNESYLNTELLNVYVEAAHYSMGIIHVCCMV